MFKIQYDSVTWIVNAVDKDVRDKGWPIRIGVDEVYKFVKPQKWLPGATPMPFDIVEVPPPENGEFVTSIKAASAPPPVVQKPVGTARLTAPFELTWISEQEQVMILQRPLLLPEVQKLAEKDDQWAEFNIIVELYDIINHTILGFNDWMSVEFTHKTFEAALSDWTYKILGSIPANDKYKFGAVILNVRVDVSECIPKK